MPHIPHDVFRHILRYKDPRYEKVRAGVKADSARALPPLYGTILKIILSFRAQHVLTLPLYPMTGYTRFVMTRHEWPTKTLLCIWDTDDIHTIVHQDELDCEPIQEYVLNSDPLERPPSELWLQCKACGPDLFVYDYARQMAATNK